MAELPVQDRLDIPVQDTCLCCKRSKTQGAFFDIVSDKWNVWEFGSWAATNETFSIAAEQGCRRCGFVYEAVEAHGNGCPNSKFDWIEVQNGYRLKDAMRAKIKILLRKRNSLDATRLSLMNPQDCLEKQLTLPWNISADPLHYRDPTSPGALWKAKLWLEQCASGHEYCDARIIAPLPRRVLELAGVAIVLREDVKPENQRYACLSHCWGPQGPSLRLTKETSAELKRGIHIDMLPKTFSDAVTVCLRLGISYLWIDALYGGIYQDDLVDWENCANSMAGIYENAYITIAAMCAGGSDDGLRPSRDNQFEAKLIPSTGMYVRESYTEFEGGLELNTNEEFRKAWFPLLTRAWAFQERQLSPRMLYFSVHRLIWKCLSLRQVENKSRNYTQDAGTFKGAMRYFGGIAFDPIHAWHQTVKAFSRLHLTYDSDKLPAIAALALKMSIVRKQDSYLYGLWRHSLLQDLQWFIPFTEKPRCRSGAPTWSWASVGAEVQYQQRPQVFANIKLLDVEYTPAGSRYMGRSTRARITLSSPIIRLKHLSHYGINLYDRQNLDIDFCVYRDTDANPGSSQKSCDEVLLMLLFGTTFSSHLGRGFTGMMLQRLHDNTDFERVGWIDLIDKSQLSFIVQDPEYVHPLDAYVANLPIETVTIV